jgi:hypothetical protein
VKNSAADGVGTLSGHVEFGGRTLFGLEGSLWLVSGVHPQGTFLATVAQRGIARVFELGAGFGVHLGDQANGPALDLKLRTRLPVRHLAAYLRYDGALLLQKTSNDGQNTTTIGVEASW